MRKHYRNVKVLLVASALTLMLPTAGYSVTPGTSVVEQKMVKASYEVLSLTITATLLSVQVWL